MNKRFALVATLLAVMVASAVLASGGSQARCADGGISQVQMLKWCSLADLLSWTSQSQSTRDQVKYLKMVLDTCKEIQFRSECQELAADFMKNVERCHFSILHNDRATLAIAWSQMDREFVTLFEHHTGRKLDPQTYQPVR